jgi:hypothetical protein
MQAPTKPLLSRQVWSKLVFKGFPEVERGDKRLEEKVQTYDIPGGATQRLDKGQRPRARGIG